MVAFGKFIAQNSPTTSTHRPQLTTGKVNRLVWFNQLATELRLEQDYDKFESKINHINFFFFILITSIAKPFSYIHPTLYS